MIKWSFKTGWLQQYRSILSVGLVCLLHLIPIWCFTFIPTQDGISHLYNAYILKQWHQPEFARFHQVYNLNLTFFPNWTNYAFFYLALHILPPLMAEKIYVTVCVLLFPFSFYYLLSAIDKHRRIYAWLGFLYSYNYLMQMGFYNFTIAAPFCLIGIGYWWKHRAHFGLGQVAMLNLLLLATYFSHFGPFVLLLFTLSFFSGVDLLISLSNWRDGEWRKRLSFFGYLLPAYFILINTHLTNPEARDQASWIAKHNGAQFSHYKSLTTLWTNFMQAEPLVYFNDSYLPISKFLLVLVGLCLIWTIVVRIQQKQIFQLDSLFLVLVLLLTVLYFKLPWRYGSPAWINPRINLFILPILLGWFLVPNRLWVKRVMVGLMLMLTFWHLGLTIRDYHRLNKDMKEFMSGARLIKPHSVISILDQATDFRETDHHGSIRDLSPFYHGLCYYALQTGSLYIGNYEPKYHYFPLHYKNGNWKFRYVHGQIDYLVAWHEKANHPTLKEIEQDYQLIYQTKQLKLYQHR